MFIKIQSDYIIMPCNYKLSYEIVIFLYFCKNKRFLINLRGLFSNLYLKISRRRVFASLNNNMLSEATPIVATLSESTLYESTLEFLPRPYAFGRSASMALTRLLVLGMGSNIAASAVACSFAFLFSKPKPSTHSTGVG